MDLNSILNQVLDVAKNSASKLDNPSYNKVNYVFLHIIIKIKAMTKNTMANKLPRKLIQKMEIVGEQIKLARLRRNLSMAQVAESMRLRLVSSACSSTWVRRMVSIRAKSCSI